MERIRSLAIAGLALAGLGALAACTHQQGLLTLNPQYRLGYDDKGETVALTYGLPNSDDLALMLECPKGSGRVELTDTLRDARTTAVVLASDGRKTSVAVTRQVIEGPSDEILLGHVPSSAPALQAFRRTGVLEVSGQDGRYTISVAAERRAGLERFFKVCG